MLKRSSGLLWSVFFLCSLLFLPGCGGGGSGTENNQSPGSQSSPTNPATPAGNQLSGQGGTATLKDGNGNMLDLTLPAGAVSNSTTVTITMLNNGQLPGPLALVRAASTQGKTFIIGFSITVDPPAVTTFGSPVKVSGDVPGIAAGTTLNLAKFVNNAWVDVLTLVVGQGGALTANLVSVELPGIMGPGTYVLYEPAAGTSTTVSNLGIALIASDDGYPAGVTNTTESLQVVRLFDPNGKPLATPTISNIYYSNSYDLDGQALTPDGSQGIMVDGGNTLQFFSGAQSGMPAPSPGIDVSTYGSDGDSVAIMSKGDEAVVSLDSSNLLLVSGIISGKPKPAATIPIPGNRDGLVLSKDDKVLLARGYNGLTVFAVNSITPVAGFGTSTVSHAFYQKADMAISTPYGEDGREGMAISPTDSSRAVVAGNKNGPSLQLLTGLPGNLVIASTVAITGAAYAYAVSIVPSATVSDLAIVGTDKGLLMYSGVSTGTLTLVQASTPTYTLKNTTATLGQVRTLGVTLDGKYVAVCDGNNHALLTIPISASGFGAPVGILPNIAVPYNDQLLIH